MGSTSASTSTSTFPHQIGLASTADEVVQLRDVDQLNSAVTARPPPAFGSQGRQASSGSRPATDYGGVERTRWSSSSAASQGSRASSWGNYHPDAPSGSQNRQSGAAGAGTDAVSYEWNHPVVDERDGDAEFVTDDDDEEGHDDEDGERTAAIVLAEQGHGEIVHGEGKDVAELYVPPSKRSPPSSDVSAPIEYLIRRHDPSSLGGVGLA